MKKLIVFSSLFVLALFTPLSAHADACNGFSASLNLVSNCGFESGSFSGGWTGTATTVGPTFAGVDSVDPYASTPTPYNGTYEAYLAYDGGIITLSQTLATVAGAQYTIKFALLNDTTPSSPYVDSFAALFGSNTLFSQTGIAAGPYTLYTFVTTASGSSTNLSFASENDTGYFELDSVSVVATPEPSNILLLSTGLLGLAGTIRRRFIS